MCQTCKVGYFLLDNKCYKCNAFQDGCEVCDSANTCSKCTERAGYRFDADINRCACIEEQGFRWNAEKLKCECSDGHNIEFTEEQAKDYTQ